MHDKPFYTDQPNLWYFMDCEIVPVGLMDGWIDHYHQWSMISQSVKLILWASLIDWLMDQLIDHHNRRSINRWHCSSGLDWFDWLMIGDDQSNIDDDDDRLICQSVKPTGTTSLPVKSMMMCICEVDGRYPRANDSRLNERHSSGGGCRCHSDRQHGWQYEHAGS